MKKLSLFIKPWLDWPTDKLIEKLKELEISEIEVPVRDGLPINPENCEEELPKFYNLLKKEGITIRTTGIFAIDERIFKAMNSCGIELARIMLNIQLNEKYTDAENRYVKMLSEAAGYCEKYNTKVGIQPHNGGWLATVMELKHLLERCDTKYIGAVWDTGHAGLAGEIPQKSLDIIYENIFLVNFKSAYWIRSENEDGTFNYRPFYTLGKECPCSWRESVECLKKLGYKGDYCIHAEYTHPSLKRCTNGEESDELLKKDLEYIRELSISD